MAVFTEKPSVTSSNCYYETLKNALILIKLGTNVDLTIDFVTTCSVLNFLLPWQQEDISKLPKTTILRWYFSSKLIPKCCNFSMDCDLAKGFSALVSHYITIDLGSFIVSHKSKIFLAMMGTTAPFKPPKQKGAHPSFGNHLMYHFHTGAAPKKW
jgi:hypothetical protein